MTKQQYKNVLEKTEETNTVKFTFLNEEEF